VVLIEDKASGQSLIQELKRDTRLPILSIKVDSDKVSRAYAVTPSIETGRVFLVVLLVAGLAVVWWWWRRRQNT
jgi:predicted phage terminase large subunit-like protein